MITETWATNAPAANRRPRFPVAALFRSGCLFCAPPSSPAAACGARRGANARIKQIAVILLLPLTMVLAGCSSPDVRYSDLQPAPTATVSGGTVTVHLGSDLMNSACYPRPKARVEGRTVYVVAYRSLREQSREFVVPLPGPPAGQPVSVVWVDPDGRRVAVPLRK